MAAAARVDIQKKTAHTLEQEREDMLTRRQDWFDGQPDLDPRPPGLHRRNRPLHEDGAPAWSRFMRKTLSGSPELRGGEGSRYDRFLLRGLRRVR
ncbi:hypothetical protein A0U93_04435 [Neoasaia chiangmaiensis]|uniref:Uncharacterized protein n=1 Tax=Neoasaia chiangmaiensis TaxID=320497 RepID=A0A1U9KNM3_9PROT|nr:hypothetical protein A0U93_04435 [Neoasaia chiangmaiensis]